MEEQQAPAASSTEQGHLRTHQFHMVNLGATHQVISLLAHGPTALWLLWLWLASDRPSVLVGTRVLLLCRCSPVGVLEDPWTIRGGYSKTIL
jgi:hypothetical protein